MGWWEEVWEAAEDVANEVGEAAQETGEELLEGDLEGAGQAVSEGITETAAAAQEGVNETAAAAEQQLAAAGVSSAALGGQVDLGGWGVHGELRADDGEVSFDVGITTPDDQIGVTGSARLADGELGADAGLYHENAEGERDEVGVTANLHARDGQIGAESGLYHEGPDGRGEVGVTVNGDAHLVNDLSSLSAQFGLDAGVYHEDGDDRTETGLTVNHQTTMDIDGGLKMGLDAGGYLENGEDRYEGGLAVSFGGELKGGGAQSGIDVGLFGEHYSGDDHERYEAGATLNVNLDHGSDDDFDHGQFSLDFGGYADLDGNRSETVLTAGAGYSTSDEGTRVGVGVGAAMDGDFGRIEGEIGLGGTVRSDGGESGQVGIDLSAALETYGEDPAANNRLDAGIGVNIDHQRAEDAETGATGGQVSLDAGFFLQDKEDRSEAGLSVNVGVGQSDTTTFFGGEAGLYAEADGIRSEATAGVNFDYDETADGGQFGVDSGIAREDYGPEDFDRLEIGGGTNVDVEYTGDGLQLGVDTGVFSEDLVTRDEAGTSTNVGISFETETGAISGQIGIDGGVYLEDNSGRTEFGTGADFTRTADSESGGSFGGEIGLFEESYGSGEHDREEFGIAVPALHDVEEEQVVDVAPPPEVEQALDSPSVVADLPDIDDSREAPPEPEPEPTSPFALAGAVPVASGAHGPLMDVDLD